ncbi:MAG: Succinate dehydrogenase/Fumarate reductase transrane subunit [Holophagaceae bacterium]|nr:Succinate dehydrogenase/Fumarate reductase transrane subunit [Holophagaceae bacterium]
MPVAEQTWGSPAKASFLASSVGRKIVMAVTGVVLSAFVTVHMLGNLQAYMGAHAMNTYAKFLHEAVHGGGVWIARAVLLVTVLLHGWAAISLTLSNWSARPQGYRAQQLEAATWSSRTMRYTGVILACFIVYHLLHLTTGQAHPDFVVGDAYGNFVRGFQRPLTSAFYILAQLCLGFHLWHGVWSFTQTFGWSHPRYNFARKAIATVLAVLVAGVNISFPISVLLGVIR